MKKTCPRDLKLQMPLRLSHSSRRSCGLGYSGSGASGSTYPDHGVGNGTFIHSFSPCQKGGQQTDI